MLLKASDYLSFFVCLISWVINTIVFCFFLHKLLLPWNPKCIMLYSSADDRSKEQRHGFSNILAALFSPHWRPLWPPIHCVCGPGCAPGLWNGAGVEGVELKELIPTEQEGRGPPTAVRENVWLTLIETSSFTKTAWQLGMNRQS